MGLLSMAPLNALRSCIRSGIRSPYTFGGSSLRYPGRNIQNSYTRSSTASSSRSKYTISYTHGHDYDPRMTIPLIPHNIGQLLDITTEKSPDHEFIIFQEKGQRLTFSQFRKEVHRLSAGLLSLGVHRGDRVGIWGPNTLEWMLTMYATIQIGAILVNLNPAYQAKDLEYSLRKVGVKTLVAARPFKTQNYYNILKEICPELEMTSLGRLKSKRLPDLEYVIMMGKEQHPGTLSFEDVMDMGGVEQRDVIDRCRKTLQFDDVTNIQFTSGTTGTPKATCLTNFHIVNNMYILAGVYPRNTPQTFCVPTPLFHAFGMFLGILGTLTTSKLIFPSAGFDALACMKAVQDERCTQWFGTPTMLIDMLHHPEFSTFDLKSLNFILSGGGHVPSELVHQLRSAIPSLKDTVIIYGMTEMGGVLTCSRSDDPDAVRFSTVGRPFPWCEVKIIDPISGEIVPIGESGELCGRSPTNMSEYWCDETKTRETIDSTRWLHSGDLAKMDENGYISIVGRIKDMINRGGENIFAIHIENHLHTHPKIQDVQVIGVPDKRLIEEVCACVLLKTGEICSEDEIRDYCRGQLAHYEVPRYVEFVSSFPLTMSNKVQKYKLREEMTMRLKLESIETTQN